jgi:prevent-host-death family protein
MKQVSLRDANQNFSRYIAEVEDGERITLLRRGRPVADIIPHSTKRRLEPKREAARRRLLTLLDEGLHLGGKPMTRDEMHER